MPKSGDLRLATPEILPQVSTNGKFYLIIRNCFWRVFILTGVLILGMQFWSLYSNLQRNSDYLVSTRPIIVTCNYTDCWGHPLADSFVRALTSEAGLPECPANAPNLLGSLEVLLGNVSSSDLENIRRALDSDATWKPPFCQPSRKTAVIIPFRDRAAHLSKFRTFKTLHYKNFIYFRHFFETYTSDISKATAPLLDICGWTTGKWNVQQR